MRIWFWTVLCLCPQSPGTSPSGAEPLDAGPRIYAGAGALQNLRSRFPSGMTERKATANTKRPKGRRHSCLSLLFFLSFPKGICFLSLFSAPGSSILMMMGFRAGCPRLAKLAWVFFFGHRQSFARARATTDCPSRSAESHVRKSGRGAPKIRDGLNGSHL